MSVLSSKKLACLYVGIMAASVFADCSSADAGIFRRIFRSQNCQPQPVYTTAPATQGAQAAPQSQYQSFSYEPGATAPTSAVPTATAPAAQQPGGYQGVYRVQPGSSVPNMFRGDRKMLGLQSN